MVCTVNAIIVQFRRILSRAQRDRQFSWWNWQGTNGGFSTYMWFSLLLMVVVFDRTIVLHQMLSGKCRHSERRRNGEQRSRHQHALAQLNGRHWRLLERAGRSIWQRYTNYLITLQTTLWSLLNATQLHTQSDASGACENAYYLTRCVMIKELLSTRTAAVVWIRSLSNLQSLHVVRGTTKCYVWWLTKIPIDI